MALKLYSDDDIQDIADAIRSKNGSNNTYQTSQMAAAIRAIPTGGGGGVTVTSVDCTTTTENGAYIGDTDGNGIITSYDQYLISQYNSGFNPDIDLDAADVNGDGVVNSADNILMSRLIPTMTAGQLIARVSLNYSDGTSETRLFPVDAPLFPSSISKIESGSFTNTNDVTSSSGLTIAYSLEEVPDLIVVYTTDYPWASSTGVADAILGCVAFVDGSTSSSMAYRNILFHTGSGGAFSTPLYTSTAYGIGSVPTIWNFTIKCSMNYKLVGGATYKWIAVKFK